MSPYAAQRMQGAAEWPTDRVAEVPRQPQLVRDLAGKVQSEARNQRRHRYFEECRRCLVLRQGTRPGAKGYEHTAEGGKKQTPLQDAPHVVLGSLLRKQQRSRNLSPRRRVPRPTRWRQAWLVEWLLLSRQPKSAVVSRSPPFWLRLQLFVFSISPLAW